MSPSNINSFVGDLVQMAQAMEQLPKVEQELEITRKQNDQLAQDVQDREISIINYKQEIEALHAKVRSLEVERDDASFRVLEAEDKEHVALAMAKSVAAAVANIVTTLDPPKPQPEPVKEPEVEQKQTWTDTTDQYKPLPDTIHSISEVPQGQSEQDPTQGQNPSVDGNTTTTTVQTGVASSSGQSESSPTTQSDTASDQVQTSSGPYSGHRYFDVPYYVSRQNWLAGGGTNEDYDFRY